LKALYEVHANLGIPLGTTQLVPVDSALARLARLPRTELATFLSANDRLGEDLLSSLLYWATELEDAGSIVARVLAIAPETLGSLNVAVGLETLKRALTLWESNAGNNQEEFWQHALTEHSFVLEQVFSWPTTVVKGKAYVGGKSVLGIGGNVVDFLVKNYFTANAALVEIKTPTTRLLGKAYRGDVLNVSDELTGAVLQVLNYRFNLQRDFYSLQHGVTGGFETFAPRCIVIIGSTSEIAGDELKTRSLELFRGLSNQVAVITFDELFEKTTRLVTILEASG
jgi:hypothetical protein